MIINCGCADEGPAAVYQSKKYGSGRRVATVRERTGGKTAVCTICSREKAFDATAKPKKGKK